MKRKYFLTQKQIRQIVKSYGGFRKYQYNQKVNNEYDKLYLHEKTNPSLWLCIYYNYKLKLTQTTLTDDTGVIIQRDSWEVPHNDVVMKITN